MTYPISIKKTLTISLSDNLITHKDIVEKLSDDLKKIETEIETKGNVIIMDRCSEFSSRTTSFKNFNKGKINLDSTKDTLKLTFRIYLVEHLIIFVFAGLLAALGLIDEGVDSIVLRVAIILLVADLVFCYIIPLMTLDSFLKDFINRTLKK
jgi:hypothetical protein